MIVASRKVGETIVINGDITLTVVEVRGDKVRLGINCPREIPVHKEEVYFAVHGYSPPGCDWGRAGGGATAEGPSAGTRNGPLKLDVSVLAWNGGCVLELARCIAAGRDFARLPVLADALEDAGCRDAALLGHFRGPGDHAFGCRALRLLLQGASGSGGMI